MPWHGKVEVVLRTERITAAARRGAEDAFRDLAVEAEAYAKGIAPVKTGAYRDSIRAVIDPTGATRASGVRLVLSSDVDHAVWVEYGNSHMAPRAVFRRTLDAVGPRMLTLAAAAIRGQLSGD